MPHSPSCHNNSNSSPCCSSSPPGKQIQNFQALSAKLPRRQRCLKGKKCPNPSRSHRLLSQPGQIKKYPGFPRSSKFAVMQSHLIERTGIAAEEPAGICWCPNSPHPANPDKIPNSQYLCSHFLGSTSALKHLLFPILIIYPPEQLAPEIWVYFMSQCVFRNGNPTHLIAINVHN